MHIGGVWELIEFIDAAQLLCCLSLKPVKDACPYSYMCVVQSPATLFLFHVSLEFSELQYEWEKNNLNFAEVLVLTHKKCCFVKNNGISDDIPAQILIMG